jgi:hypothetical protein
MQTKLPRVAKGVHEVARIERIHLGKLFIRRLGKYEDERTPKASAKHKSVLVEDGPTLFCPAKHTPRRTLGNVRMNSVID